MELKRLDDSAQNEAAKATQRNVPSLNTKISQETREALKQIDAIIRNAEQKSGHLLLA